MKKIFKDNIYFIIPFLLFVIISTLLLLIYPKFEIHIAINKLNNSFFDSFFKYITYLGEGIFLIFIVILFLFIKFKNSLILTISGLNVLAIVMVLKKILFKYQYRPFTYYRYIYKIDNKGEYNMHFVDGVSLHDFQSFPSGHTSTAFTVFFALALFSKNKILKFVFFVLALLVGYSRMYLSQHFLADVLGGAVIGTITVALTYYFISKNEKGWYNKSLNKL